MSRIGTTSSSRTCWTMCMAKDCSPSRSIGERARRRARAGPRRRRAGGRAARRAGRAGAHAAPARDVGHRGQTDERQGAGVERPRSVRSHCAGLSQSCGRGVTRRAPASAGAHRRPPAARLRRLGARSPGGPRRAGRPRLGARPAGVLGLRRGGGGWPAAVLGLPGRSCASCAASAARAAACRRRAAALPVAPAGARAGMGARRASRGRRARSCTR